MQPRTDLAVEVTEFAKTKPRAVFQTVRKFRNIEIVEIKIKNEREQKILNRSKGTYITISSPEILAPENKETVHQSLMKELKVFVSGKEKLLVVGLGNKNICSDSIGPRAVEKVFATRHLKKELIKNLGFAKLPSVCAIAPGVLGQTGMETAEIVKALAEKTKPELIVLIDALAAGAVERLGTTIQLTNSGIAPGSGVNNSRAELSERVLNVPVLAIGVPTVVDLNTIVAAKTFDSKNRPACETNMMVTPKNIDEIVTCAGNIIASALNCSVFPMFSKQELEVLAT